MGDVTVESHGGWLKAGHHWMIVRTRSDSLVAAAYHSGAASVSVPFGHRPFSESWEALTAAVGSFYASTPAAARWANDPSRHNQDAVNRGWCCG